MITKYQDFVNEGLLSSLKSLFGKLLSNISDELKKPVEDLTNKLDKTKGLENIQKVITDYLTIHRKTLIQSLLEAKTIGDMYKITRDNLKAIYASIDSSVKYLGEQNYSYDLLFKESPESLKKLFSKNEKNFDKNVDLFTKNLITSLGKQFGLKPEDITKELEAIKESLLFEEVDPATGQEKQIADATGEPVKTEDTKTPEQTKKDEAIKKLRDAITRWFDNSLYKTIKDNLSKQKNNPAPETTTEESIDTKVDKISSTNNKEGVKKMLDAIANLNDNGKYAKVRELLKELGFDENTFGKF